MRTSPKRFTTVIKMVSETDKDLFIELIYENRWAVVISYGNNIVWDSYGAFNSGFATYNRAITEATFYHQQGKTVEEFIKEFTF